MPALLAVAAGCATQPPAETSAPARPVVVPDTRPSVPEAHAAPAIDPGLELPPGAGRDILLSACLVCHDLGAIELFSGFYDRERWRELVLTMQANGAAVDAGEIETLSDYLAEHFGVTGN